MHISVNMNEQKFTHNIQGNALTALHALFLSLIASRFFCRHASVNVNGKKIHTIRELIHSPGNTVYSSLLFYLDGSYARISQRKRAKTLITYNI
jgi:hypothetical protein